MQSMLIYYVTLRSRFMYVEVHKKYFARSRSTVHTFLSQLLLLVTNKQNSLKINQFIFFNFMLYYTQASIVDYKSSIRT